MFNQQFNKWLKKDRLIMPQHLHTWIHPPWYSNQINPQSPYYNADNHFNNQSCRRWVTLRGQQSQDYIHVDQYGIIHLPHQFSVEIWIYDGERLYTPATFDHISQELIPEEYRLRTSFSVGKFSCESSIIQIKKSPFLQFEFKLVKWEQTQLKPVTILFAIRPFDVESFCPIFHMEIGEHFLYCNHQPLVRFDEKPDCSYFSNASTGDLPRYFEIHRGNTGTTSQDGSCTGFLGFYRLPAELEKVTTGFVLTNHGKTIFQRAIDQKIRLMGQIRREKPDNPQNDLSQKGFSFKTFTKFDQLLTNANMHLETFSSQFLKYPISLSQIMVLNRYAKLERSRQYLDYCLKRVSLTGTLGSKFIGDDKIIIALSDYYQFSRDLKFIKEKWPAVCRIGFSLIQKMDHYQPNHSLIHNLDKYLWTCLSLKEIAGLGETIGHWREVKLFKTQYLKILKYCCDILPELNPCQMDGESLLNLLAGLDRLGIDERYLNLEAWNDEILHKYEYEGGFFAPLVNKGINLRLTVELGLMNLRLRKSPEKTIEFLFKTAGALWNWPDQVNPKTYAGIGRLGHDPEVLFRIMLLTRSLLVEEEGNDLWIFPGNICQGLLKPLIDLRQVPTRFGLISIKSQSIADTVQITFDPHFYTEPKQLRIQLVKSLTPVYADAPINVNNSMLISDPKLRIVRFKNIE